MLKAENISSYYGNIQALENVSIEVNKGEIVSIIGSNGAGKSTLLMYLQKQVQFILTTLIYHHYLLMKSFEWEFLSHQKDEEYFLN